MVIKRNFSYALLQRKLCCALSNTYNDKMVRKSTLNNLTQRLQL